MAMGDPKALWIFIAACVIGTAGLATSLVAILLGWLIPSARAHVPHLSRTPSPDSSRPPSPRLPDLLPQRPVYRQRSCSSPDVLQAKSILRSTEKVKRPANLPHVSFSLERPKRWRFCSYQGESPYIVGKRRKTSMPSVSSPLWNTGVDKYGGLVEEPLSLSRPKPKKRHSLLSNISETFTDPWFPPITPASPPLISTSAKSAFFLPNILSPRRTSTPASKDARYSEKKITPGAIPPTIKSSSSSKGKRTFPWASLPSALLASKGPLTTTLCPDPISPTSDTHILRHPGSPTCLRSAFLSGEDSALHLLNAELSDRLKHLEQVRAELKVDFVQGRGTKLPYIRAEEISS